MANNYIVHASGHDAYGGGYNPANHAFAGVHTNGLPVYAITGGTYSFAGKSITKAGGFAAGLAGILAYVSGTNITTGRYEITASDANSITFGVDIGPGGDGADAVANVGGCLLIATAWSLAVDNTNPIIIPSGQTIPLGAGLTSASGGRTLIGVDTDGTRWSPDNTFTRPIIRATGADIDMLTFNTAAQTVNIYDLDFDGDATADLCVYMNCAGCILNINNCRFYDASEEQINITGHCYGYISRCDISGGTYGIRQNTAARAIPEVINCVIHDTGVGIGSRFATTTTMPTIQGCVIHSCSASGINNYNGSIYVYNCTFAGNTLDIVLDYNSSATLAYCYNSIFYSESNIQTDNAAAIAYTYNCAFKAGAEHETGNGSIVESGSYSLAGDPFTDSANDIYNLDPTDADYAYLYSWTNGMLVGSLGPRGTNAATSYGPEFPAENKVANTEGTFGWNNDLTPSYAGGGGSFWWK